MFAAKSPEGSIVISIYQKQPNKSYLRTCLTDSIFDEPKIIESRVENYGQEALPISMNKGCLFITIGPEGSGNFIYKFQFRWQQNSYRLIGMNWESSQREGSTEFEWNLSTGAWVQSTDSRKPKGGDIISISTDVKKGVKKIRPLPSLESFGKATDLRSMVF